VAAWSFISLAGGCTTPNAEKSVVQTTNEPAAVPRHHAPATRQHAPEPNVPSEPETEVREETYPSGQVSQQAEGYVAPDGTFVRHGLMTLFYEDGTKKAEIEYKHGKNHGRRITWYQTGQEWGRGEYVDGLEHGTWTAWWPNGFKQREWEMVHGSWHGTSTEWHDNGEIKMQFEYVNGVKQGPFRIWDDRGNLMYESEYVDGVEQPRP
jgi:hypothetical protein